jgi:hypothetical protein
VLTWTRAHGGRVVPDAVVRGLQLAVGLPLAQKGIRSVWYTASEVRPALYRPARVHVCSLLHAVSACELYVALRRTACGPCALPCMLSLPLRVHDRSQWCWVVQEHSLHMPEGGEGVGEISVYFGLAAAAFLLLSLYPNDGAAAAEEASASAPTSASPAEAPKRGGGGLPRPPPPPQQPPRPPHAEGGLPGPGRLAPNRDSSTSLNHWLGVERAGSTRAPLKAVVEVHVCPDKRPLHPFHQCSIDQQ